MESKYPQPQLNLQDSWLTKPNFQGLKITNSNNEIDLTYLPNPLPDDELSLKQSNHAASLLFLSGLPKVLIRLIFGYTNHPIPELDQFVFLGSKICIRVITHGYSNLSHTLYFDSPCQKFDRKFKLPKLVQVEREQVKHEIRYQQQDFDIECEPKDKSRNKTVNLRKKQTPKYQQRSRSSKMLEFAMDCENFDFLMTMSDPPRF